MNRGHVECRALGKHYPQAARPVIEALDLNVPPGELLVLVGPSGCGKSTVLRMLAGLESISHGDLFIDGRRVNDLEPKARDVAMVFQDYALYPHMSVRENLAFPLKMRRMPAAEQSKRIARVADMLHLVDWLERKPAQLSGGQRQRVAMGRALVRDASVFLLDEPLSNLDAKLRGQVRFEIAALQRQLGATMLYVTHDQTEAMTLGQRVAVLDQGKLQQIAAPHELYARPANTFVAGFIGQPPMNLLPASVLGHLDLPAQAHTVGLRPEDWRIASAQDNGLDVVVDMLEFLGHETLLYARHPALPQALIVRLQAAASLHTGQTLRLTPTRPPLLFDASGNAL